MWESGACIHIGLFRSERIVGQERLFCTAGAKGKKDSNAYCVDLYK